MTTTEFRQLSLEAQEEFINSGGIVINSPASDIGPCIAHSSVDSGDKEQSGSSNVSLPSEVKELNSPTAPTTLYPDGFDITDPLELLLVLDDNIASGRIILHPWQIQYLLDFAEGGVNDQNPFQSLVRAANGSGKDKYIIAPCAVWLCMKYFRSRCVVTSSSGVQLDNQTCAYIEQLCNAANRKFGSIWKVNYRYYECLATESPIVCFATDESGKAEGYHPLDFNCKMALFESEAKTVPDEIYVAQNKCTGYTHRALVSTPGLPLGHFFDLCSASVSRKDIKSVKDVESGTYIQYHITAFDCSHISKAYIEQMKRDLPGGENGAAYKSQVLAEFGTTDEMVVIPYTYVWQAFNRSVEKWVKEEHNKAGLDLSDGGDETVLIVRNGNKVIAVVAFRFDNTEDTIAFLNEQFVKYQLCHHDALIFADCGGLGKPMLDRMKRQGWSNIRYVDNRSKPFRPKTYKNRGAELWFEFANFMKQGEIIIPRDERLIRQLSTRYYKTDGQIHQLLSKIESRSRGYPSPDRADALILAFTDYKSSYISPALEKEVSVEGKPEELKPTSDFTLQHWAKGNPDTYRDKYRVVRGNISDIEDEISEFNRKQKERLVTV